MSGTQPDPAPRLDSANGPLSCAELDKLLPSTDIIITTPFWPAYLTRDRLQKAKQLELSLTAGVGSDHVDLHAAAEKGITVAEVSQSFIHSFIHSTLSSPQIRCVAADILWQPSSLSCLGISSTM